jgi:hypothetical protein
MRIFYSWQSDRDNSTNRGFIEKALQGAAKELEKDKTLDVDPVVDRDVAGTPGSQNIAEVILKKIDQADVFVCDVSIITPPDAKRPCPNPNVIFELGYALRTLGEERIVMVMNTEFAPPEQLPFDLKMKSVITYNMRSEVQDKGSVRKQLQGRLRSALEVIIQQNPPKRGHSGITEHDIKLFDQFRSDLPSTGSISFINKQNMAGWSFELKKLKDLDKFYYEWNDPEHEFLDPELETLRNRLYQLVTEYQRELAANTFPTDTPGWQSVPEVWEDEQPERFDRAVKVLHDKAGEIVNVHRELFRIGIRKCERS